MINHARNELTREIHRQLRELITPQELVTLMDRIEGLANVIRSEKLEEQNIKVELAILLPLLHQIKRKLISLEHEYHK